MVEGTSVPFFIMNKEYEYFRKNVCLVRLYKPLKITKDNLEKLSSLFVEWQMLIKLETILNTDADFYYDRLDVSVLLTMYLIKTK
jgi:hypothetical protein